MIVFFRLNLLGVIFLNMRKPLQDTSPSVWRTGGIDLLYYIEDCALLCCFSWTMDDSVTACTSMLSQNWWGCVKSTGFTPPTHSLSLSDTSFRPIFALCQLCLSVSYMLSLLFHTFIELELTPSLSSYHLIPPSLSTLKPFWFTFIQFNLKSCL